MVKARLIKGAAWDAAVINGLPDSTFQGPYPNEHAARVRDPGDFQPGSFRSKDLPESKIRIILGRLKGETTTTVQAYRFPIDAYTPAEAKQWLKDNKVEYKSFEAAAKKETAECKSVKAHMRRPS